MWRGAGCRHPGILPHAFVVIFVAAVARGKCPPDHVELFDGECKLSWVDSAAIKPIPSVYKLCSVDADSLAQLRKLADELPDDLWIEPVARFSDSPIDYKHVVFHFVTERDTAFSEYLKYPVASKVHAWLEPILLNITSRYSYADAPRPQGPGYLNTSIPRLILARLGPGAAQAAHMDRGLSARVVHKIHIPVTDGDGKATLVIRERFGGPRDDAFWQHHRMDVGFAYEVNNLLAHYAENTGEKERTHLMFEFAPHDVGSVWTDVVVPESQSEVKKKRRTAWTAMTPEEQSAAKEKNVKKRDALRDDVRKQRERYKDQMLGAKARGQAEEL